MSYKTWKMTFKLSALTTQSSQMRVLQSVRDIWIWKSGRRHTRSLEFQEQKVNLMKVKLASILVNMLPHKILLQEGKIQNLIGCSVSVSLGLQRFCLPLPETIIETLSFGMIGFLFVSTTFERSKIYLLMLAPVTFSIYLTKTSKKNFSQNLRKLNAWGFPKLLLRVPVRNLLIVGLRMVSNFLLSKTVEYCRLLSGASQADIIKL